MEFWSIFYLTMIVLLTLILLAPEKQKRVLCYVLIFIIWFIGAFRYKIGEPDYNTYSNLYNIWDLFKYVDLWDVLFAHDVEPMFNIIVATLTHLSMTSQSMFVLYYTITVVFLFMGLRRYSDNYDIMAVTLCLFLSFPAQGGYWWSFVFMRQAVAVSIVFWGASYIRHKAIVFLLATFVAVMFHYSAILGVLLLLMDKTAISTNKVCVLACFGFILNAMGIMTDALLKILEYGSYIYGRYTGAILGAGSGVTLFSPMAAMLTILYLMLRRYQIRDNLSPMIVNAASLYILLRVYMSFGSSNSGLGSVVHRFETYFLLYFLLMISMGLTKLRNMNNISAIVKGVLVIGFVSMFCIMSLRNIAISGGIADPFGNREVSSDNINYEFNFDLFK